MIGRAAHKSILEEDYDRHRAIAETARERDDYETAVTHYRICADLLREVAELEASEQVATERLALADNLNEAAATLESAERVECSTEGAEGDQTDTSTNHDCGVEGAPTSDAAADAAAFLTSPPDIDFNDVGGMTELKQTLTDTVIDPLERPDLYEAYELGVINGILLHGPPGTGKTYVTRALAGELGYNFVEVTPSDLTSSLVGEAADNVADLFSVAREHQPCLLFIDEIDAVAGQRSGGAQQSQSERQMVNQLLTELSDSQGEDIVVVAATNLLSEVDDALIRSGRFDERIEVPPPDATAREAILQVHLRSRPVLAEGLDWETIRQRTKGYTASDMELIAASAARRALKEARQQDAIQPVTQSHIETAIDETDSSLAGQKT